MSNTNKPDNKSPVIKTTVVTKAGDSLLNDKKGDDKKTNTDIDSNTTKSIDTLKEKVIPPHTSPADKVIHDDQIAKQKIVAEAKSESTAAAKPTEIASEVEKPQTSTAKSASPSKDAPVKKPTDLTTSTSDSKNSNKPVAPTPVQPSKPTTVKASEGVEATTTAPAAAKPAPKATNTAAPNVPDYSSVTTADSKTDTKPAPIKKTSMSSVPSANKAAPDTALPRRVAILGGNRIPFARSNSSYADVSNIDMLTAALNGLVERYDLQDERIGEVVAGAVLKLSRDLNLTREAALNTALDPQTPTYDISQACGTGLQSTFAASNKIALGLIDSAITGGVDTTSDAPIAVGDGLRKALIKLGAAKNNKQRIAALAKINPKNLIDTPQNGEPRTGMSMGDHQAITALEWNISREAQDELAYNSHKNLAKAYDEGFFDDLITPFKGLTRDNNLRPDTKMEKLAKLKPVFGKKNANPTMTAANSTPLTDGASCVLLGTDDWAEAHGLKALAYITHQETAAVDFIGKDGPKEGLLMAPAYAVPRMLERAGITLQDFDFYEIHEAFASQVLSTLAAWEDETFCKERLGLDEALGSIDRSKLNVKGSSLAAGHPFAATGGRILATAAKLLNEKGSGRALISICAAGGQGVTCILEK